MLSLYLSMLANETDKLDFENLYRKYGNFVLKYANSRLHHQQNAEDVAHDVWLYMAENFHQYHFLDENSFKNYIMKAVKNQCASLFRKQANEMDFIEDIEENSASEVLEDHHEILLAFCEKEDCKVVVASIKQLAPCYRDVLNLFYLNESSPKEIAKILCLKDSTVRQRLSRGRKKLIAILQEKGVDYEF